MKFAALIFASLFSIVAFAQEPASSSVFDIKKQIDPEGVEIYESNLQMRNFKKFGVSAQVGGVAGTFGVNGELNLENLNTLMVGMGMGQSYNTFNVRWKKSLESAYLSPFATAGYSKWYNSGDSSSSYNESEILKRVLTDDEKREGRFGADFLAASIGLEYNQLEGEMSGTTFFGEIVLLAEVKRTSLIPTGSVGVSYLF